MSAEIGTDIKMDTFEELTLQSVLVSPLAQLLPGDHSKMGASLGCDKEM